MQKNFAEKLFKKDFENSKDQSLANKIDGSEKVTEVIKRGKTFVREIKIGKEDRILVISHGKFIDIFLKQVLELDEKTKPNDYGFYLIELGRKNIITEKRNIEEK